MITCIVYSSQSNDLNVWRKIIHDEAAYLSEDKWNIQFQNTLNAFVACTEKLDYIDIICFEIKEKLAEQILESVRKNHHETKILLVADLSISPMRYLRPSIHPDSLLLRPYEISEMRKIFRELFLAYMQKEENSEGEERLVIENKSGKIFIPYNRILYIESREKKLFVRTAREEYGFYDTVEHLVQVLPNIFIRCHRGFIVNRQKIKKVFWAKNEMELESGERIPVSRTYRSEVRKL